MARTGVTFAQAAEESSDTSSTTGARRPVTIATYRTLLRTWILPTFGERELGSITTPQIEAWFTTVDRSFATRITALAIMNGIFIRAGKAYGLQLNPVAGVVKPSQRTTGDIEVFSPDEIHRLVDAAASAQDAAIYLTAALTGMRRGELLALRWREVDFPNDTIRARLSFVDGTLGPPKSGKVRSIPMAPEVARTLIGLRDRGDWLGDEDLVFPNALGEHMDGRALRRRYAVAIERAGLRQLRFHDLRHTFGTRMIGGVADIRRVQEWMGHADVETTMKYLHYVPH